MGKNGRITGLVIHCIIGAGMILPGLFKLSGQFPMEEAAKMGLDAGKITLIGTGEIIAGLLLIIPATAPFGALVASGFWGGVICTHLLRNESYVFGSVMLALTWLGAYLRDPRTFGPRFGVVPAPTVVTETKPVA